MAVNRIRGAFTAPRKGETFELRAGLVYGDMETPKSHAVSTADLAITDRNMHTRGKSAAIAIDPRAVLTFSSERNRFKKRSWP